MRSQGWNTQDGINAVMKKENHMRSLSVSINQDVYTESKNLVILFADVETPEP